MKWCVNSWMYSAQDCRQVISVQSGWPILHDEHTEHEFRLEYDFKATAQSVRGAGVLYNAYAVQNGIQTTSSLLQAQDNVHGFVEKSKQIHFWLR